MDRRRKALGLVWIGLFFGQAMHAMWTCFVEVGFLSTVQTLLDGCIGWAVAASGCIVVAAVVWGLIDTGRPDPDTGPDAP